MLVVNLSEFLRLPPIARRAAFDKGDLTRASRLVSYLHRRALASASQTSRSFLSWHEDPKDANANVPRRAEKKKRSVKTSALHDETGNPLEATLPGRSQSLLSLAVKLNRRCAC